MLRTCVLAFIVTSATGGWVAAQDKLIAEGDQWRYFKGTEEPPADWKALGFDDSQWLAGATPIGYSVTVPPDLNYATVLDDMQNNYWAFYARKKFTIADASVAALRLQAKYDDGFIAYLNGEEVLRQNMPAGDVTKDTPGTDHETNMTFMAFPINCPSASGLKAGENVLAIEVHNGTLASSDISLSVELEAVTDICPTNLTCQLRPTGQVLLRWTKPIGVNYDSYALLRNGVALDPAPKGNAASYTDKAPLPGDNNYELSAIACAKACAEPLRCTAHVEGGGETKLLRGDVDDNGSQQITDGITILNRLFRDPVPFACPDAADVDDNGAVNLTDAIYLLRFLFQDGSPPPAPYPTCGADASADDLGGCTYASCPA